MCAVKPQFDAFLENKTCPSQEDDDNGQNKTTNGQLLGS